MARQLNSQVNWTLQWLNWFSTYRLSKYDLVIIFGMTHFDLIPDRPLAEVTAQSLDTFDETTTKSVANIMCDIQRDKEQGLRYWAEKLGDIEPGEPMFFKPEQLKKYYEDLSEEDKRVLDSAAQQIGDFAKEQKKCLSDLKVPVPGGYLGHDVKPVASAGCYAPGGRYPLPSSVLMTALTARVAGVKQVWLASPKPQAVTLAAAYIAGVDGVMAVGGAQAIAAFAYGAGPLPCCDVIVGPGNRWVTAAKKEISGYVRIDMLAGPSEVLVVADSSANPAIVAADLIAQCEHDVDARGILVTDDSDLVLKVRAELQKQLVDLSTAETAQVSLSKSASIVVSDWEQAVDVVDKIAPEHLEVMTKDAESLACRFSSYGAIFVGEGAAEVLGDYGLGPNHTLPTGGTGKAVGGLSVFNFLCVRTSMYLDKEQVSAQTYKDVAHFARLEGLEGHARAAEMRLQQRPVE